MRKPAALEDGYWLSHDSEARAWHAREVTAARKERAIPHVAGRVREAQGITEVLIYAGDRSGLFASLAAAISAAGANIVGARVHTTRDGAAFDVFSIQTTDANALEHHSPPAAKPPSRRTAAFAIEPWVRFDNEITPDATVVEASGRDRLGLLAELAHVCADAKVSIVSAHIDTFGVRASDVFYVQEEGGGQITNARRISTLRSKLEAVLRAAEPEAPADPAKKPLAVARHSSAR